MNSWPRNDDERSYPILDQGSNLLTLFDNGGPFKWTSLVKRHRPHHPLRITNSATIFPPTRPPRGHEPNTTILKNAEQGANFLRTYLPDVDVPAELIRGELSRDAMIVRALTEFDPNAANLLTDIEVSDTTGTKQTFLVFPMGELFRDLNLSPFLLSEKGMIFKPSSRSARAFKTPIQQISASRAGAHLAVRTFGYTSLLQVTPALTEVTQILHADTNNRPLVDFLFSKLPLQSFTVNDFGALYKCDFANGRRYMDLICTPVDDQAGRTPDSFWRVARSGDDTRCLVASSKMLKEADVRSRSSVDLFTLTDVHVLTSVEDELEDNMIRLLSTQELLWIDRRFPGRPLLGYRHSRKFDRSLAAQTIPSSGSTLLTSRKNRMITVYDISCPNGLIHLENPPYCLFSDEDTSKIHLGQTLLSPMVIQNSGALSFIRLSDRGSLHQMDVHSSLSSSRPVFETLWTADVKQLSEGGHDAWAVPYEGQDFTEADLSAVYERNFNEERQEEEGENVEAIHDLVARISTFWQDCEVPIEHMVTTYEAIIRAGDEGGEGVRADFLAEGSIHSREGYKAAVEGPLSAKEFVKDASWHQNISATLRRLDSGFMEDVRRCREELRRYDLAEGSGPAMEEEEKAEEQLALELGLSADVFSREGFLKSSDEDVQLESMTKTLSLTGEPGVIDFGYFRPVLAESYYEEGEKDGLGSIGVRSLLRGWKVSRGEEDGAENVAAEVVEVAQSQPPPLVRAATPEAEYGGRKKGKKRVGGF